MKKIISLIYVSSIVFILSLGKTEAYGVDIFRALYGEAELHEGTRLMTYDELKALKSSGNDFVLVDVLGEESYKSGHIPGAKSLPLGDINEESVAKMFDSSDNIVVYCGSFKCRASTKAAQTLNDLGYKVLDYKGGLKEWQKKGNALVSG